MNHLYFAGRLAAPPVVTNHGENKTVCKFTLISNEYAGKDEDTGESTTKAVRVQFTAFNAKAVAISQNCLEGDQLIVAARLENNDYTPEGQDKVSYNMAYILTSFDFGAPGPKKRAELANRG